MDDAVCKLGVSTLQSFYARIKAARTVTYQDIELLGIEVFDTEAEARTGYKERLKTFERLADRRAWVHFDEAVRQWLANECMSNPPTLDAFKDAFQNDPARRKGSTSINVGLRKNADPAHRNLARASSAPRKIALMNGNMLESGGKMTLHIKRNRKSVRRRGERRTPVMIRIGMRLSRNMRKVGRRRVGNGMRMILSIGRSRNNVVGSLHRIIRTIRRSEGCICRNIVGGRRRKGKKNSGWKLGRLEGKSSETGFMGF